MIFIEKADLQFSANSGGEELSPEEPPAEEEPVGSVQLLDREGAEAEACGLVDQIRPWHWSRMGHVHRARPDSE